MSKAGRGVNAVAGKKIEEARKAVIERRKARQNKEAAKTVEKKGSIAKKTKVSATDIREATTANQLDSLQRRIDNMDNGNIKTAMQKMLDAQRKVFEAKQAADVDRMGRKQQQAVRDKKPFKGHTPSNPFEGMKKGGMAKKYNKGGYANCGASVPATQGKK